MQIVENWADVTGTVRAVEPARDRAGFQRVEIAVERIGDVAGFPNLVGKGAPGTLAVLFPDQIARRSGIVAGAKISCRVRLGGRRSMFVHPDHVSARP